MKQFIVQSYHLEIVAGFLVNIAAGWFLATLATKTFGGLITDLTYCILSLWGAVLSQKMASEYD